MHRARIARSRCLWIAIAACGPAPAPPPPAEAPLACSENATACRDRRALVCRAGAWVERSCELGCRDGNCIACVEGETTCTEAGDRAVCVNGRYESSPCADGVCRAGVCQCAAGSYRCGITGRQRCTDDGQWVRDPCSSDRPICADPGRCLNCIPGSTQCVGDNTSQTCSPDGEAEVTQCTTPCNRTLGVCAEDCTPGAERCRGRFAVQRCADEGHSYRDIQRCDGRNGEVCTEGQCASSCDIAAQVGAPSGCRFFAPTLHAWAMSGTTYYEVGETALHAINAHPDLTAHVTVSMSGMVFATLDIPPRASSRVLQPALQISPATQSVRIPDGAVEISSTTPIYVVQHLYLQQGGEEAWSGDTAFLLPYHLLASAVIPYRVLTQPHRVTHSNVRPGGFTVVSTSGDGPTRLTASFRGDTAAGSDLAAYTHGETITLDLRPREVIHFLSNAPGASCTIAGVEMTCTPAAGDDLTGTVIESDHPVAVFNGGISRIPTEGGHIQNQLLEQVMPPDYWGDEHVLVAREIPNGTSTMGHEQWVVVTDEADNDLTFDPAPAVGGATRRLAQAGDSLTFNTYQGDFAGLRAMVLRSSRPALVARYFYATGGQGSSTFTFERPTKFWRNQYDVESLGAEKNRLLVIVPGEREVTLDGGVQAVARRPGPEGFTVLEIDVARGLHALASEESFGLLVYGYSFALSGGLSGANSYSYAGPVGFGDAVAR